ARAKPNTNPGDSAEIAREAGADYALTARVLEFDATTREGYSKETVEDSQMAAERGEDARMAERVYKVKSLTGKGRVERAFVETEGDTQRGAHGERRTAVAEADEIVTAEGRTSSARLPPKMRFLEELTNKAFARFFETYEDYAQSMRSFLCLLDVFA